MLSQMTSGCRDTDTSPRLACDVAQAADNGLASAAQRTLDVPAFLSQTHNLGCRINCLGEICQEVVEILEQADIVKKRGTRLEVHEQIQVAVRTSLAPGDGAEHGHPVRTTLLRDAAPEAAAIAIRIGFGDLASGLRTEPLRMWERWN